MGEREAEGTDGRRRGRVSGPAEPVQGQSRGQEGADGLPEESLPGVGTDSVRRRAAADPRCWLLAGEELTGDASEAAVLRKLLLIWGTGEQHCGETTAVRPRDTGGLQQQRLQRVLGLRIFSEGLAGRWDLPTANAEEKTQICLQMEGRRQYLRR